MQASKVSRAAPAAYQAPALDFQGDDAEKLARNLREWSKYLLSQRRDDDEERQSCQLSIEEHVMRLDVVRARSEVAKQDRKNKVTRSKESLLYALCASMFLRDRKNLKEAFQLTVKSLPTVLAGLDPSRPDLKPPDASMVSRAQVEVDSALCGYWKSEFKANDYIVWLWADSSPQAGLDWLMSMFRLVKATELESCVQAAGLLRKSVESFAEAVHEQDVAKMQQVVEERHSAGNLLAKTMLTHRQIPMILGSGAVTLDQKLLCMARKFYAEAQTHSLTRKVMAGVRAVCTDLGTEKGFTEETKSHKLSDILPQWMQDWQLESCEHEGLDVDLVGGAGALSQEDDADFVFPNALASPGLLHIFSNMSKDLHQALSGFEAWLPGMKAIATLFHDRSLRERFVATCVQGTPFAGMEALAKVPISKPAMWRWGTMEKVIPSILTKRQLLLQCWDQKRFENPHRLSEQDGNPDQRESLSIAEDSDFQLAALSAAVACEGWWMYTAMLAKLNRYGQDLSQWAEGCSCHFWLGNNSIAQAAASARDEQADMTPQECFEATRKHLGFKPGDCDGRSFSCPLAGQRSMELADGSFWDLLEGLHGTYLEEILCQCACKDPEQIQHALSDFARGKSMIVEYLQQKLACWSCKPWCMAALNNADEEKGRERATQWIQDYDTKASQGADASLHHRLTVKFFHPGSSGRKELEAFAAGAPLRECRALSSFVWGLKFAPTVERIQEAEHAITKRATIFRGKASGPFVSCRLRFGELREIIESPDSLQKFMDSWNKIISPDDLAKCMGFWQHPMWQDAVRQKYAKRQKMEIAAMILYAHDPESQYRSIFKARRNRLEKKKGREKRIQTALQAFNPKTKNGRGVGATLCAWQWPSMYKTGSRSAGSTAYLSKPCIFLPWHKLSTLFIQRQRDPRKPCQFKTLTWSRSQRRSCTLPEKLW